MAFRSNIAQRYRSSIPRFGSPNLTTNCRISTPASFKTLITKAVEPDPGDGGLFRRLLQKGSTDHPATSPGIRSMILEHDVSEKLNSMAAVNDRLRFDGLAFLGFRSDSEVTSARDLKKLLKHSQLEIVKSKLRGIPKTWISNEEYVQICTDACSNTDQGLGLAKMLDDSGTVVVFGNLVCLNPVQVMKAMETLVGSPTRIHPRTKEEFAEMEIQKAAIDEKAESLVRKELWAGLGFFVIQSLGFMRLTFWELSWDVMEPICFYVTSIYCMIGYAFFLRTSKEPSFEGFFQSRLGAKRKRLMKRQNFDIGRYEELKKMCNNPHTSSL